MNYVARSMATTPRSSRTVRPTPTASTESNFTVRLLQPKLGSTPCRLFAPSVGDHHLPL